MTITINIDVTQEELTDASNPYAKLYVQTKNLYTSEDDSIILPHAKLYVQTKKLYAALGCNFDGITLSDNSIILDTSDDLNSTILINLINTNITYKDITYNFTNISPDPFDNYINIVFNAAIEKEI